MTVTILSIIILVIEVLFVVLFFLLARKQKRLVSKSTVFWFIPVFFFIFLLYLIGFVHQHESFGFVGVAKSVAAALRSFAFDINTEHIHTVLNINVFYSIAFYSAYLLGIFTVIGTAMSLAKDFVLNMIYVIIRKNETCDVVVGYNDSSFEYFKKNEKNTILWANKPLTSEQIKYLYDQKIPFIKGDLSYSHFKKKSFKKKTRYNFIAFKEEEANYQQIIEEFTKINKDDYIVFLHLEVKYQEMELVRNQYLKTKETNPNLFVRAFSRYELIARKFVTSNTIPSLLDDSYFNENRTIKEEKEINVIFYGFGKINSSLFTMFCQNNQLVEMKNNKLQSKVVNYYIIDKDDFSKNDKRIDYLVKSFDELNSDFGKMELPCNLETMNYDINSYEAINKIKKLVSNENSYNIIFVSYGTDFENAETAIWLQNELNNKRTKIICRLKEQRLKDDNIIYFGNEKEVINHSFIVDEELQQLAKDIDANYSNLATCNDIEKELYWDRLSQVELYSNYYSAMNITFKLNLLGLDLTKDKDAVSLTNEEFMKIYLKDCKKSSGNYEEYFKTEIRNVIAYSEKLRWNAFYLFNGYKPMNEDVIKINKDGIYRKNSNKKLHACLTSHEGLHNLHQFILDHPNNKGKYELKDIDFYKYDYMVFDNPENNLINNLIKQGYKIVKK